MWAQIFAIAVAIFSPGCVVGKSAGVDVLAGCGNSTRHPVGWPWEGGFRFVAASLVTKFSA